MQGRRSKQGELLPLNDNIDRIRNQAMEAKWDQNQERLNQGPEPIPNFVPNPSYEP